MLPVGGSGPPPIKQGEGLDHLRMIEPFRLVSLDAGAFDWLWRMVESRALSHQDKVKETSQAVYKLQAEVSIRAVIAFREAAGTLGPPPAPVKRMKRRAAPAVEPPKKPGRRLVKHPKDQ